MTARSCTDSVELLTTAQVAEMVGRTVATINRWALSGRLPVAAQANGRVFHRHDVMTLIDELAVEAEDRASALREAAS